MGSWCQGVAYSAFQCSTASTGASPNAPDSAASYSRREEVDPIQDRPQADRRESLPGRQTEESPASHPLQADRAGFRRSERCYRPRTTAISRVGGGWCTRRISQAGSPSSFVLLRACPEGLRSSPLHCRRCLAYRAPALGTPRQHQGLCQRPAHPGQNAPSVPLLSSAASTPASDTPAGHSPAPGPACTREHLHARGATHAPRAQQRERADLIGGHEDVQRHARRRPRAPLRLALPFPHPRRPQSLGAAGVQKQRAVDVAAARPGCGWATSQRHSWRWGGAERWSACVRACVCVRVCVCACGRVRRRDVHVCGERTPERTRAHTCAHMRAKPGARMACRARGSGSRRMAHRCRLLPPLRARWLNSTVRSSWVGSPTGGRGVEVSIGRRPERGRKTATSVAFRWAARR